jgi:hypothetical protein
MGLLMKIKKFNESRDWEYSTQLIKDIIIEIKDEYPQITGDINETPDGILIKFNTLLIEFKGESNSVERFKDINRFESIVLECIDRINNALNTSAKISGSYNFTDYNDDIKILIPN